MQLHTINVCMFKVYLTCPQAVSTKPGAGAIFILYNLAVKLPCIFFQPPPTE